MAGILAESRPARGEFPGPTLTTLPEAIAGNIATLRARTRAHIMAVVKADGYGHGATTVARVAVAAGVDWLGTTDLAEGFALRAAGLTVPILTWLNPSGLDAELAATARLDIAIGSVDELEALGKPAPAPVRVHLNLDTGMGREGCPASECDALVARALQEQQRGTIHLVGLMGHLSRADEARSEENQAAVRRLRQARRTLVAAGFEVPITHLAATSGTLCDPAAHFDLVRVGAGLVGIDPSGSTDLCGASRLTAPIVHTATAKPGTSVGYGSDYATIAATNLAVLPVGYADGIPREISPDASVAIRDRRYRIVGRVSMDQVVIDTGTELFPRGTTATIFGPRQGAAPTIHDWAGWARTIPHTIVTGIGPRVRRTIA